MAFFGPHNAEINQVNAQIKAENGKISGYQYTLGVMLLKKLDEGMVFDDEIMQQYEAVKASRTAIENANAELARIQQLIADAELAAKANSFFGKGGKKCPSCGNAVTDDMAFCNKCGTKLPVQKTCPNCGNIVSDDMAFCNKCGTKLS